VTCIRRAWLVLGSRTLELEDRDAGYSTDELNLGYPEIRENMTNRPDADGVDDRTTLWGSRAVSASIRAYGPGMAVDEIVGLFAPFMRADVRPELHYVLDRPGAPERMCVVRAAGYGWPITGGRMRDVNLSWVAADPIMRDPVEQTASSRSGSDTTPGRYYNLTFNRIYPPGGGSPTTGEIVTPGDVPARPLFRIFGPITDPVVDLQVMDPDEPLETFSLAFVTGTRIDAGHWLDVDADRRSVLRDSDPTLSAMSAVDWAASTWPVLPPAPAVTYMTLTGSSTSGVTQVAAIWRDGYLT